VKHTYQLFAKLRLFITDGKQKKVAFDFEPFKPINTSIYRCDSRFITEPLAELLQDNASFGFIVMDGNVIWNLKKSLDHTNFAFRDHYSEP